MTPAAWQSGDMSINLEDHLDADHLAVLELLPGDLLDFSDVTAARARINEFMAHMPAPEMPDSVEVTDHHAEAADGHEVLVRVYRPKERRDRSPGLYWIHGGGMVLGDVGMDDASCAAIASDLSVVVASVEYRLAPEFPYPTPLEDCYCGLVWFFEQAEALGLDTARIAVGGLAAGLALLARDRKHVSACFQLLRFPMLDDRNETPSRWSRSAPACAPIPAEILPSPRPSWRCGHWRAAARPVTAEIDGLDTEIERLEFSSQVEQTGAKRLGRRRRVKRPPTH